MHILITVEFLNGRNGESEARRSYVADLLSFDGQGRQKTWEVSFDRSIATMTKWVLCLWDNGISAKRGLHLDIEGERDQFKVRRISDETEGICGCEEAWLFQFQGPNGRGKKGGVAAQISSHVRLIRSEWAEKDLRALADTCTRPIREDANAICYPETGRRVVCLTAHEAMGWARNKTGVLTRYDRRRGWFGKFEGDGCEGIAGVHGQDFDVFPAASLFLE